MQTSVIINVAPYEAYVNTSTTSFSTRTGMHEERSTRDGRLLLDHPAEFGAGQRSSRTRQQSATGLVEGRRVETYRRYRQVPQVDR